jgi:hypothetical protein
VIPDWIQGAFAREARHIRPGLMDKLEHFEVIGKRGFYRPSGKASFEQAVDRVAAAMRHARSLGLQSLLVNSTAFTGLTPPDIFARHDLAVKWAEGAGPGLHVALVARPELIDPEKIGVLMAQTRGASGDVFRTEAEAICWLDARHDNTAG